MSRRRSDVFVRPPPPREQPPPLPPGPPPPMFPFGGDSRDHHAASAKFSFHSNHGPDVRFPEQTYPPHRAKRNGVAPREGQRQSWPEPRRTRARDLKQERYGDRSRAPGPSFRPLLTSQRATTPEQMLGMSAENKVAGKFLPIDDVSDSEEEAMDVDSQSEAGLEESLTSNQDGYIQLEDTPPVKSEEPARKKQAQDRQDKDIAASSVPKWSNPDPYTALPPPDESQRKKKDVVKLIRRARVIATHQEGPENAVAANADFISLNFVDSVEIEGEDRDDDLSLSDESRLARSKAPSGPRMGFPATSLPPRPQFHQFDDDDNPLGSRKRTHNDVIKDTRQPKPMNKKSRGLTGYIVPQWQAKNMAEATPWVDVDHYKTQNMGFWLHKEICDFYTYVKPQEFEQTLREDLLSRLRNVIISAYPDCDICSFGSFPAGIYLPTADMDVVCISNSLRERGMPKQGLNTARSLSIFAGLLMSNNLPKPRSIEVITKAKVPLIKYVDRLTNLRVDLSFENTTGLVAVQTYLDWKRQFPAMPVIVTLIKQFLAMRGLHEVRDGGLGGFSVTCMVTSLLQHMPQVQSGSMVPQEHLGDVLMEFLDLYGNEFNTTTTGIRLTPPGYFDKRHSRNRPYQQNNRNRLSIEDPNRPDNDISGGTKEIDLILKCFSEAYEALQRKMSELHHAEFSERRGQTILGTLVAGDYSSFQEQRRHLRVIYEDRFEGIPELPREALNTVQWPVDEASQPVKSVPEPETENMTRETESMPQRMRVITVQKEKPPKKKRKVASEAPQPKQGKKAAKSAKRSGKEKERRMQRASSFKELYPHISNLPEELSREEAKKLKRKIALRGNISSAPHLTHPSRPEAVPEKVSRKLSKRQRRMLKAQENPENAASQANATPLGSAPSSRSLALDPAPGSAAPPLKLELRSRSYKSAASQSQRISVKQEVKAEPRYVLRSSAASSITPIVHEFLQDLPPTNAARVKIEEDEVTRDTWFNQLQHAAIETNMLVPGDVPSSTASISKSNG